MAHADDRGHEEPMETSRARHRTADLVPQDDAHLRAEHLLDAAQRSAGPGLPTQPLHDRDAALSISAGDKASLSEHRAPVTRAPSPYQDAADEEASRCRSSRLHPTKATGARSRPSTPASIFNRQHGAAATGSSPTRSRRGRAARRGAQLAVTSTKARPYAAGLAPSPTAAIA